MAKVCKFYKQKRQVSYDCETWQDVTPPEYRQGDLYEKYSSDCGWGSDFLYRWVDVEGEYMCNGYDKYTKKKQEVSYDNGVSWDPVPNSDRIGELVERFSSDCCQLRTVTGETCDIFFRKVNASIQEASLDGELWVQTGQYSINYVISDLSEECFSMYNVKYLGIPVEGASNGSCFNYAYYVLPFSYSYEYITRMYINSNYVIVGCDKEYSKMYDYADHGGIDKIYVASCAVGPSFYSESKDTLKEILVSNGTSGVFGGGMDWQGAPLDGSGQFSGFTELEKIEGLGSSNITKIQHYMFSGCTKLSEVVIPNTCFGIGNSAFKSCTSLSSVTINSNHLDDLVYPPSGGSSAEYVMKPYSQFEGCTSLKVVTFQDNYNGIIYSGMFAGCPNLQTISLGKPTHIRVGAFRGSTSNLSRITCLAVTPPTLDGDILNTTSPALIYVPAESVDIYKSAPIWSRYADRILPIL